MVKYDLGPGALGHKLELRNRIDTRSPATRSPGLHDSLVGTSSTCRPVMYPPKSVNAPPTSRLISASEVHGLHDSTELYDFVELFRSSQHFVNARPARLENRLLVNGFCRMRNLILGSRPSPS